MKSYKCLMGILLTTAMFATAVFATPLQGDSDRILKKSMVIGVPSVDNNRDCSACDLDFTEFGSECCDSAWDEFGINCAGLESDYGWDCAGCECPGDAPPECGDGYCNGDETYASCPADCDESGCSEGQVADCADDDCCPESWIGDGFADCEDQAYGCDLTCYDNDGGDCADAVCGDGVCNGDEDYDSCPDDCSAPGSECSEDFCADGTYWDGFSCYDCSYCVDISDDSACEDPYDCCGMCGASADGACGPAECGDGYCNGDEDYMTCPDDCIAPGECDAGFVSDCADDDCCPESWIGDGFADCEDQAFGCDLTCYDNDGGDCAAACPDGEFECWDGTCAASEADCPEFSCPEGYVDDCDGSGECCSELWIGDGLCDGDDQAWGCDLQCYDNDGGDCYSCEDDGLVLCWDLTCAASEADCPDQGSLLDPADVCIAGSYFDDGTGNLPAVTVTWTDPNPAEECGAGYVDDCVDDDCCPESWIGDGFEDCEDQAWGCDLTCYDNDGGDCAAACPDGEVECWDGSCAASAADCPEVTCLDGEVPDCVDDDCCPEAWIGDGFPDCVEQQYGCDLTCYDNDGGDCDGGRDTDYDPMKLRIAQRLNLIETPSNIISAKKGNPYSLDDSWVSQAHFRDSNNNERSIVASVMLNCIEGLNAGFVYEGALQASGGEFTVYGWDASDIICGTVSFYSDIDGSVSNTVDAGCVMAGDETDVSCADGTGGCDTAGTGDVNADGSTNVLDIVSIVNYILDGGFDDCQVASADVNGDGAANVLDIVTIVNWILDGRAADATSAKFIESNGSLELEANGFIGAVQMTLSHGSDFSIELTNDAMVAEYRTRDNTTTLVIVAPGNDHLFTANGDYKIVDAIVANATGEVSVAESFSLSVAYPNPFNPSTSMSLTLSQDSYVSVKVYNLMGQVVATLADSYMNADTYNFTWNASDVPSGVYMISAEADGSVSTQKVMYLK